MLNTLTLSQRSGDAAAAVLFQGARPRSFDIDAVATLRQAVSLQPTSADLWLRLGQAHAAAGNIAEATGALFKAWHLDPDNVDVYLSLSAVLADEGRFIEAAQFCRDAIKRQPGCIALHHALARTLGRIGLYGQAAEAVAAARAIDPAHPGHAVQTAWLDARQDRLDAAIALLDETLAGHPDHAPARQLHAELLLAAGRSQDWTPPAIERPAPELIEQWRARLGAWNGLRVGLAWNSGGPAMLERSLPLSNFAPLAILPGLTFFSLQDGPAAIEGEQPPEGLDWVTLGPAIDSDAQRAAALLQMDVVICTDSALAYQAAGLGCRTWIVLPEQAQAHWQRGRADSPWYPGVRLFRQQRRGIWEEVVAQVQEALTQLLEESPPPVCREGIHALLLRAARLHADHRPAEAEQLYRQMLADRHVLPPAALAALHEHLSRTGRHQLIEHLKPWHAEDQFWLEDLRARALARKGDTDTAFAIWAWLVEKNPPALPVYMHYGLALNQAKQYERAIEVWNKAMGMYPNAALMKLAAAISHQEAGKREQAVPHLRRAASLMPLDPDLRLRLGILLREQNHIPESKHHLQAILTIDPHAKSAWDQLGFAAHAIERRPDLGLICFRHSNELQFAHYSCAQQGHCHFELKQFAEAVKMYDRALVFKPDDQLSIEQRARALHDGGYYDEALVAYEDLQRRCPDHPGLIWHLAWLYLVTDNFDKGWKLFHQYNGRRPFSQPEWKGESLEDKTILVHNNHGYGDMIQFGRLISLIKAKKVILAVRDDLVRLFENFPGADELIPLRLIDNGFMDFDYQINEIDLAGVLENITTARNPVQMPYLKANPALEESWRKRLSKDRNFKIGIAWTANAKHYGGRDPRMTKLEDWAPLAELPNVTLYSLNKDEESQKVFDVPHLRVVDLSAARRDFADLAAIMSSLDLVITVDSAPAHLAGAMCRPVWTILPYRNDWRWRRDGQTHPWYPTMRLFRARLDQPWSEVLLEVRDELVKLLCETNKDR
jgi:tetratricopeptide (TPR) repeat protein